MISIITCQNSRGAIIASNMTRPQIFFRKIMDYYSQRTKKGYKLWCGRRSNPSQKIYYKKAFQSRLK